MTFAPFFRAARERGPILVGPRHLRKLAPEVVGHRLFLPIPDAVAWRYAERTTHEVQRYILEDDLVLIAAGMATNLIVHRLWPLFPNSTLVDVGAIFDPYVGRFTRKNYRKRRFQETAMKENLT